MLSGRLFVKMSNLYSTKEGRGAKKSSTHSYTRYIYFYLIVLFVAKCLYLYMFTLSNDSKLAGLRSWIVTYIFSYCTLKYVFSIIRQVDKHFHTDITKVVEDSPLFYEGSFMSDLKTYI